MDYQQPQFNFTDTSRAAARAIEPKANTKRAAEANRKIESLRNQIKDMGCVPCC